MTTFRKLTQSDLQALYELPECWFDGTFYYRPSADGQSYDRLTRSEALQWLKQQLGCKQLAEVSDPS